LEGTAYWYENITDDEPIYIGNTWAHAPIEENKTYFLREVTDAPQWSLDDFCTSFPSELLIYAVICDNIEINHIENITISPNPASGRFYLKGLTQGIDYQYVVTDITGRVIIENQPITSNLIDLSKYSEGIYFIKISTPNVLKTFKVIKN
jgi:hypothetical protein